MVKLVFQPGVPLEVVGKLLPLLEKWLWVVPTWCHEIEVEWGDVPEGDDGVPVMAVSMQPEYRRASLIVCPAWLGEPKAARERAVVHELSHLLSGPLTEFYDDLLKRMKKGTLRNWVEEQHRRAVESATVDIAAALLARRRRK